jgi:hypothetical protein
MEDVDDASVAHRVAKDTADEDRAVDPLVRLGRQSTLDLRHGKHGGRPGRLEAKHNPADEGEAEQSGKAAATRHHPYHTAWPVLVTTVITSPYWHQGVGLTTDIVRVTEAVLCPARHRRVLPAVAVLAGSLVHPSLIRNRATLRSHAVRCARNEPGERPCVIDPTPR